MVGFLMKMNVVYSTKNVCFYVAEIFSLRSSIWEIEILLLSIVRSNEKRNQLFQVSRDLISWIWKSSGHL